ncbi:unnamed protein product [Bursaphelenchus okinawaensis]|uniref:Major facilitator superfamily (MFS) profile domain-containing protein n=1 Tax=Bursaphelenchus okinawaensis TaxID=465554 RepID=A0A811KY13_9BILA|nr:unnamed protein product [Bursaphelenchus okinawaensis]CAG9112867.1 unnamed protein product [Bursaphelenchus okinawaensis]
MADSNENVNEDTANPTPSKEVVPSQNNEVVPSQSKEVVPSQSKEVTNTLSNTDAELLKSKYALTSKLVYALAIIGFGSSFQFGYNIGVINAPDKFIRQFIAENHNSIFNSELSDDSITLIFSLAVSLFPCGAMIGALASAFLADHFGRRTTLHANNGLALLGSFLMTSAKFFNFYPLFHIGRFVIGLNAGISSSVVPMYFTELSTVRLRGSVASLPQLVVTISILFSTVLGLPFLLGNENRWPFLFAVMSVPAVCQIVGLFGVAESPRYTLFFKENPEKALNDLSSLRGDEKFAQVELHSLEIEKQRQENAEKVNVASLLGNASFRWPLFLAAFLMMAQQLSGINAAMFFSTEIFRSAGLNDENSVYATIGVGVVNVLMTVVSVYLVDLPMFGRRSLLLIGMIGMIFASLALVISMYCFTHDIAANVTPYLACAFLLIFVIFFATGPGSIPFFYVSEVFPSSARASASAVCVATNWTFTVIVGVTFLPIEKNLKEFTFLIFTFCCLVASIVIMKFLPETKGKTVEEVEIEMQKKKRLC